MAAAVETIDVVDAFANLLARAAEIDPRRAARLIWTFVNSAVRIGDEIDAADEEGEVVGGRDPCSSQRPSR